MGRGYICHLKPHGNVETLPLEGGQVNKKHKGRYMLMYIQAHVLDSWLYVGRSLVPLMGYSFKQSIRIVLVFT